MSVADEVESFEPTTYKQAISCSESIQLLATMNEKMQSLYKKIVRELVKILDGRKLEGYLVAKGFSQVERIDFCGDILTWILSIVPHLDVELERLDVKTSFLSGDLEEEILMNQTEGFQVIVKEHYAYILLKSLYGLKQSPRQ